MSLITAYKAIKPTIVAICAKISSNPQFADIIGTGVIVDSTGLILTNSHVVKAIGRLPRKKSSPPDEWPAFCCLFHYIPDKGMATIDLEIAGVGGVGAYSSENYYGDVPDIGVIRVKVTDLPFAQVVDDFSLQEGEVVGIAGFPMGTKTLRVPGWIHQLGPSLKVAHVSAILPFVCSNPHAILIDSIMQGGNSGSPVFNKGGKIVGLLYGGLNDTGYLRLPTKDNDIALPYSVPTNLSYAVPSQIISATLKKLKEGTDYLSDEIETQTLTELMESKEARPIDPKNDPMFSQVISEDEIIDPEETNGQKT